MPTRPHFVAIPVPHRPTPVTIAQPLTSTELHRDVALLAAPSTHAVLHQAPLTPHNPPSVLQFRLNRHPPSQPPHTPLNPHPHPKLLFKQLPIEHSPTKNER